jgi:fumarylacetoacetase
MSAIEVPDGSPFPLENLPYGVFSPAGRPAGEARVGVAVGDQVLDLAPLLDDDRLASPSLAPLMAQGPAAWREVRSRIRDVLGDRRRRDEVARHLRPQAAVTVHLPVAVGDYVDFYSSRHHAENLGRILRPGTEPLPAAWRHLPIGYHGRAGTVVVSGTPVVRPRGQRRGDDGTPTFGPSARLDIEAEVGFLVGVPSRLGEPVAVEAFDDHVFGVVLVNDWSARDLQAWEYVPLGPFLGKSFATSISAWVLPLEALAPARVPPPPQDPPPLPYLRGGPDAGLDLTLAVELNGEVVSRPPFAGMYWTPAQQLAHLTVNGASVRTGDLFASGTVSGPEPGQRGSFIELTWNGAEPLRLGDGTERGFLADGDAVRLTASAPGEAGATLGLGPVEGTILPARS